MTIDTTEVTKTNETDRRSTPKISVIIPTYNRAGYIKDAVRTVLDQTVSDLEVVVVIDGSTDETKRVVESIEDDRVRYVEHEQNQGLPAARNTGIEAAVGEYIAWLDDDNVWLPEKLETELNAMESAPEEVGVVSTSFWKVDGDGNIVDEIRLNSGVHDLKEEFLNIEPVGVNMNNCLIKRQVLENIRFDEHLVEAEDLDFWIEVAQQTQFKLIDEPLARCLRYHDERSGASRSIDVEELEDTWNEEYEYFTRKHAKVLDQNALTKIRGHFWFMLGFKYYGAGYLSPARRAFFSAARTDWKNPKYWILAVVSLFGITAIDLIRDIQYQLRIRKHN